MSGLPFTTASNATARPSFAHEPTLILDAGIVVRLRSADPSRSATHSCGLPLRFDVKATCALSREKRPGVSIRAESQKRSGTGASVRIDRMHVDQSQAHIGKAMNER